MIKVDVHRLELLSVKKEPNTNEGTAGGKFVNSKLKYLVSGTLKNPGEIKTTPSQPEAKLIERSSKRFRQRSLRNKSHTFKIKQRALSNYKINKITAVAAATTEYSIIKARVNLCCKY